MALLDGLLGSTMQGVFGLAGAGAQFGYNQALAAQQNQYNIDMWKMQADYNSPQAQMQRFSDAGLNPNLIYGQGNNGNMSTAPQKVTPEAPEFSRHMAKIGEAFNIENLKTLIAKRKQAEANADEAVANADNADINFKRNQYQLEAERHLGHEYTFDYNTGRFIRLPDSEIDKNAFLGLRYTPYLQKMLADSYYRGTLIPSREALYKWQKNYLVPQVVMSNYEAGHYPTSFWIGQGTKVLNSLTSIPGTFSPLRWIPRSHPSGSY